MDADAAHPATTKKETDNGLINKKKTIHSQVKGKEYPKSHHHQHGPEEFFEKRHVTTNKNEHNKALCIKKKANSEATSDDDLAEALADVLVFEQEVTQTVRYIQEGGER